MLKRSIILADTYFHHELLAKVCEKEEQLEGRDTGRLQQYMNNPRLKDEGFTDFIYARMLKQRKVGRVLNQPAERNDDLKEYLSKHPKLSWVHAIRSRRYIAACDALHTQCMCASRLRGTASLHGAHDASWVLLSGKGSPFPEGAHHSGRGVPFPEGGPLSGRGSPFP